MIDRHPAVIVRCASAEDVAEGIRLARANGLPVTVKGGGHGVAGRAVCDGGVMLDLASMKRVNVEPGERTATVEPGITLGDLDRETHDRLAALKTRYDPTNLFRHNQNIQPLPAIAEVT